jgi:hypothetical protein
VNATPTTTAVRKPSPREAHKILDECRDLTVKRMQGAFSAILDKVGDVLMDRANRTDVREEQQLLMDARDVMRAQRPALMADFEKRLRRRIDERLSGEDERKKPEFAKADLSALTLVETATMDEAVITGNLKRVIENACYEELALLNRGLGQLLERPDLETDGNPLAPATVVDAFADALREVKTDTRIKLQVLKEMNQVGVADVTTIYNDLNKRLLELHVVPAAMRAVNVGGGADRARHDARHELRRPEPPGQGAEVDVMALFQRMFAGGALPRGHAAPPPMPGLPPAATAPSQAGMSTAPFGAPEGGDFDFPQIQVPGAGAPVTRTFPTMAPTPSGYVPAAPIISTVDLHEGITRLQAGQTGFEVGGAAVQFSGIPAGLHNVLRDLQESPLGQKANQLESMTIEMVAMLFDFVFDTKDLPDGIKALLARLQMPVLKAAMLDGAFFAKKTHPARMLVNELAQAGLGWSPVMGQDDPLYRRIEGIVHAVLERFADDLGLFEELRADLKAFLAEEEQAAEANIAVTAEEINQHDRYEVAGAVARSEIERRIESYPVPAFLAQFLRRHWQGSLAQVYVAAGEDSDAWNASVTTLEDLVWSIQPKRSAEDRRHLVALLPSLLKRISAGMQGREWAGEEREAFMTNLVEAHAAAVKPTLAHVESPTAAVAEQARAQAQVAKAVGDEAAATKAEKLAEAMAPAPPPEPEPERELLEDEYLEIARSLERGMWVEFEGDDGQLSFAKLAWVSPLRGTYLFTNRQGQKALSITAEELAGLFRDDRARLVEAEPLIDRAVSSMMAKMEDRFAEAA